MSYLLILYDLSPGHLYHQCIFMIRFLVPMCIYFVLAHVEQPHSPCWHSLALSWPIALDLSKLLTHLFPSLSSYAFSKRDQNSNIAFLIPALFFTQKSLVWSPLHKFSSYFCIFMPFSMSLCQFFKCMCYLPFRTHYICKWYVLYISISYELCLIKNDTMWFHNINQSTKPPVEQNRNFFLASLQGVARLLSWGVHKHFVTLNTLTQIKGKGQ